MTNRFLYFQQIQLLKVDKNFFESVLLFDIFKYLPKARILENRVVDQIQKSAV